MQLKEKITEILEQLIPEDLFLVELTIASGPSGKVTVLLDGDHGVQIDQCADISRELGNTMEELELISDKYTLEVSSLGIDAPLVSLRQYKKNVGRDLVLYLNNDKEVKARLEEVNENGITVLEIVQKGNRKAKTYAKEKSTITFEEIKKAKILVSFN